MAERSTGGEGEGEKGREEKRKGEERRKGDRGRFCQTAEDKCPTSSPGPCLISRISENPSQMLLCPLDNDAHYCRREKIPFGLCTGEERCHSLQGNTPGTACELLRYADVEQTDEYNDKS